MAASIIFLLFFILSTAPSSPTPTKPSSPYLSQTTFLPNYNKMTETPIKIYIYQYETQPQQPMTQFHTALRKTHFVTEDPEDAHLFYIPFPLDTKPRSIARVIRDIRVDYPFWNRSLGADHFYVFCDGLGYESDRNVVELKKNAVQISCLNSSNFVPHKDIVLPRDNTVEVDPDTKVVSEDRVSNFKGYFNGVSRMSGNPSLVFDILLNELKNDSDFLVKSEEGSEDIRYYGESKFCLFFYGSGLDGGVYGIGEALRYGCVPVIISEGPVIKMPFMDVLRWADIAVFVRSDGGVKGLKNVLDRTCEEKYEEMKMLGKVASKHFDWHLSDLQPFDAFHTLLYQLWLRRHVIRYTKRDIASPVTSI